MKNLKKVSVGFLLALFIAMPFSASADVIFGLAKQLGGTGSDFGNSITLDSSGNVYTTGTFAGTVDFDPGIGTSNLASAGSGDIFISKLDASGSFVWAKQLGGTGFDVGNSITLDSSGNVYTTGYFLGTADFDPGAGTANLTSAGSGDIFISKLVPADTTPSPFTFTDQTDKSISTAYESNTITVAGINSATAISISSCTGTVCEYKINSGAYTASAGTVVNGDTVTVHQTSSSSYSTTTNLVLDIGGVSDTFSVATTTAPVVLSGGSVPVFILQAMSDAIRKQETINTNSNSLTQQPQTPTPNYTGCTISTAYSPTTGNKCPNTQNNTQSKFIFTKNLRYRDSNTEVKQLQMFLNKNNYTVSISGAGSIGYETNYFGPATKSALIKFQKANDIPSIDGIVGPLTRAKINKLN